ncbi:MAG: hypothetical protein V3T83_05985, partial [Acidobacteriota bacterium]
PYLLQQREKRGLRIFPVILDPVDLQAVDWLRPLQCRPKDAQPLSSFRRPQAEEHLAAIAKEIRLLLAGSGSGPEGSPEAGVGLRKNSVEGTDAFAGHATNREELEALATEGRTPSVRRDAIQSLARRYGDGALDYLRDFVLTSKYPAARCVAMDQIAKGPRSKVLPWLTGFAEEHPDSTCRARAADEVIKLTGLPVCEWALQLLRMEDNALVARSTGYALYSLARLESGRSASTERKAAANVLKTGLPRSLDGSGRECVIGAAILLSEKSPEDRDWATSAAVDTPSAYHRARSLAIVLRHWSSFGSAIKELEVVANGSEELASDHARAFLKWTREKNWKTVDRHLGLGRR